MPSQLAYFQLDQFSIMPFDGFSFKLQLAAHRCLAVCRDKETAKHVITRYGLAAWGAVVSLWLPEAIIWAVFGEEGKLKSPSDRLLLGLSSHR